MIHSSKGCAKLKRERLPPMRKEYATPPETEMRVVSGGAGVRADHCGDNLRPRFAMLERRVRAPPFPLPRETYFGQRRGGMK